MTATETEGEGEGEGEVRPAAPATKEEKPLIDLGEILKSRRAQGQGLGVAEAILFLDYMDRKDERLYRREQGEKKSPTPSPNPEVETLKGELTSLKSSVADLTQTLKMQTASKAQQEFANEIKTGVKNEIMPTIEGLEKTVNSLVEMGKTAPPGTEAKTSELAEATHTLRDAIDKLGEKAGAKALSLDDVEKILGVMDKLRGQLPKEAQGEFDWRTTGITTAGEVATEFIKAWQEVQGGREETYAEKETTPPGKKNIIERQLLLYLQRKMKEGAASFSPYDAAEELGATPRQVMSALESLTEKGLWMPPTEPTRGKKSEQTKTQSTEETIAGVVEEGEVFRAV